MDRNSVFRADTNTEGTKRRIDTNIVEILLFIAKRVFKTVINSGLQRFVISSEKLFANISYIV